MKKVIVHYFTGTGNTKHAVRVIIDEFNRLKWGTQIIQIKGKADMNELIADLHIFIYPVYALGFPNLFGKYIKSLKNGNNAKTAIIANHGMINLKGGINTGTEGTGPNHAASILKKRGFDVFYTDAVGYPENITIIANAIPDNDASEIINEADKKVKIMAQKISNFEKSIKSYNFVEKILSSAFSLLFRLFGRWHFGKLYSADKDCNNCGICVKSCPANVIRIFNKKPAWNWKCEACFGCFNICPKKAINISIFRAIFLFLIGFIILVLMLMFYKKLYNMFLPADFYFFKNILIFVFSTIINFTILYFISIYLIDKIIFIIEQIPLIKSIFREITYSKKMKRYIAFDYKADNKNSN